jgi:hypothetical protein
MTDTLMSKLQLYDSNNHPAPRIAPHIQEIHNMTYKLLEPSAIITKELNILTEYNLDPSE